jgi:hypothetical protein
MAKLESFWMSDASFLITPSLRIFVFISHLDYRPKTPRMRRGMRVYLMFVSALSSLSINIISR